MFRLKNIRARCGIRVAKVKGKAFERGKQRGEQLGDVIRAKRDRWVESTEHTGEQLKEAEEHMQKTLEQAEKTEDAINTKFPEIVDELRGIARGSKIPYDHLKLMLFGHTPSKLPFNPGLMQPRTDSVGLPIEECSSFAATGPGTADGYPIMAKNGDYSPPDRAARGWGLLEQDACLIYVEPAEGNRHIAVGAYPEWPGNSEGLNEKGLALCGSGVTPYYEAYQAYEKGLEVGVPIHYIQSVLYARCDNIDDAVKYLKISPRGYNGRNLNLLDKEGNILKAEISFQHLNLIWPHVDAKYAANWFVAGTSHFASQELNWMGPRESEYPSSYRRFDRLMELLTANAGKIDFDLTKRIMRDHRYGPGGWSLCRHGPVYTLSSFIMQPADCRVWCCVGHPCEHEYEPFAMKK